MHIVIQFPLADVRDFLNVDTFKLDKPPWPLVNERLDFVRHFGPVRRRKGGGVESWAGEGKYCDAIRAIRFTEQPLRSLRKALGTRKSAKCTFRRFFCTESVVRRLELGLALDCSSGALPFDVDFFVRAIRDTLEFPMKIPYAGGEPIFCQMQDAGKALARLYLHASTEDFVEHADLLQDWWVTASEPSVVVETERGEFSWEPASTLQAQQLDELETYGVGLAHFWFGGKGRSVRTWLVRDDRSAAGDGWNSNARKVRLNVLRLNAEQSCLKQALRQVLLKRIPLDRETPGSDRFQLYLNDTIRKLEKRENYGLPQEELLRSLILFEDAINSDERRSLLEQLSSIRQNIHRNLKRITEERQRDYPVVVVNKIENKIQIDRYTTNNIQEVVMGDQYKNITGSTIINRSVLTDSLNKVRIERGEDVAKALELVADVVSKSGNKQAGELFDSFNEELKKAEPKKSVLRSLWDGLVSALPTISTMAGVAQKIASLFA
jgi:hypothetical protein